ncbi:MAG TPA: TIGR03013 family XrtA/PEP-CTERM system glycosyltransferase [Acidiferrobacterales bacterium]|nr:TIGR03013 family XrtA/PEP-CTERM system glycosyltransferase [Acidiferrobacterales bacterium]
MIRIFNHYINANVMLQMAFDFAFVLLAMMGFGALYLQGPALVSTTATHSLSLATWTFVVGSATGIYQASPNRSLQQSVTRALVAALLMLPLAYGIFSLIPPHIASSAMMAYAAMGTVAAVIAHRSLGGRFGKLAVMQSRILVLGTGPVAKQVSESLLASDPHARIIGFFPSPNEREHSVPEAQIFAGTVSLAVAAERAGVDEVIVALSERRSGSMSLRDLLECKISGIRVSDISTHFEKRLGQIRLDYVNAGWLIFGDGFNQGFLRTAIKRVFDVTCAAFLLVLTLPLMLLTMVLIAVESRGPVFYRQERVGLNGKNFEVVKFRSMRIDAEQDGNPRWALACDDRVTHIGRLIRRVRIDELPQLYNVLKGEMSMVGPRPERPFFVDSLTKDIAYYAVRHSVKPGVTGWAQVRYEYGATVEDAKQKLQYDLYYVKNHTLFLDMLIMFETVSVVLTGKGAR